jgi:cold shock CspA family protein
MQGTVKWFSLDRGYGFVTNESGEDYYFRVDDVRGGTLPTIKSKVEFDAEKSARGPRAKNIRITALASNESSNRRADDRVSCLYCGKRMVPRLEYCRGSLMGSICPFCGKTYRDFRSPPVNWARLFKPIKYLALFFLAFVFLRLVITILASVLGELWSS